MALQALDEFVVQLERQQRQADQVVEIDRAAVVQGALVIGVEGQAHLGQPERHGQALQLHAQRLGGQLAVFGVADGRQGHALDQLGQLLAAHPIHFLLVDVVIEVAGDGIVVSAHPGHRPPR